jgi:hypothetical protein
MTGKGFEQIGEGIVSGISMNRRTGLITLDLFGHDQVVREVTIDTAHDAILIYLMNQKGEPVAEGQLNEVGYERRTQSGTLTVRHLDDNRLETFVFSDNHPLLRVRLSRQIPA